MEPVELEIKDEPMGHFNPVGWWVRGTTHFCSLWVKKCWLRGCTKLVQITDMCIYIYHTTSWGLSANLHWGTTTLWVCLKWFLPKDCNGGVPWVTQFWDIFDKSRSREYQGDIVLFAKKWRAGNPSVFIFYYIILSSCSSFQEGLPKSNLSLLKWLLVSHNSWSLLMLLGVQHWPKMSKISSILHQLCTCRSQSKGPLD